MSFPLIDSARLEEECQVCFDLLNETDANGPARLLSCTHIFHERCIESWSLNDKSSTSGPTCPTCRAPLRVVKVSESLSPVTGVINNLWNRLFVFLCVPNPGEEHRSL